jgi:hypothetical protein
MQPKPFNLSILQDLIKLSERTPHKLTLIHQEGKIGAGLLVLCKHIFLSSLKIGHRVDAALRELCKRSVREIMV